MSDVLRPIPTRTPQYLQLGSQLNTRRLLLFLCIHAPLAVLMHLSSGVATMHAGITLAVGFWWALTERRLERIALAGAYITGAEVLWRMTGAHIPWEAGKYAVAAIFLIAILRFRGRTPGLPLLYFALLLPSVPLTLMNQDLSLEEARQQLSFNLSGPFALMVCGLFFARLRLTLEQLQRIFWTLMAPIAGIATVALYGTITAEKLQFTDESNFATSGGFGPNQVSSVLGLGALFAVFCLLQERRRKSLKAMLLSLVLLFAAQSALTFSRGGLYNTGGALLVALPFLLRERVIRQRFLTAGVLIGAAAALFIFPRLDAFTGGALSARFQDTTPTGRDSIARADLMAWQEHPILGVGPGGARSFHRLTFYTAAAAHTEITRLPAEHGIFGFIALLLLLVMSAMNVIKAQTPFARALAAAFTVWTLLYMANAAMRTVAPSFVFGLAFIQLATKQQTYSLLPHRANAGLPRQFL